MEKMKYIIYKSNATIRAIDLDSMLEGARKQNARVGITGILLAHNQGFIQYIEGPGAELDSLYEKIKVDPRHHAVITLSSGEVFERQYEKWAMGYLCVSKKQHIESITQMPLSVNDFNGVVTKALVLPSQCS